MWANKKCKYFNIYKNKKNKKNNKNVKKNTWRYHYFIPVYQQSSYDLQFLRYLECDRLKLVIWLKLWVISCPFILPLKTPKNQNFEKMKKLAGDIITLHKCTKNHNHMRYSSWDREWDRQCFFGILGHFLPFYDPNNEENQNLKKKKQWKKHLEMSSLYTLSQSYDVCFLRSWDME